MRISFTRCSISSADARSHVVCWSRASFSAAADGSPFIGAVTCGGGGRCGKVCRDERRATRACVVAGTDAAPGNGDVIPFAVDGRLGSFDSGGEPQLAARTLE